MPGVLTLVALSVVLFGCTPRASFHTERTVATVVAVKEVPRGPAGLVQQSLYLPVRGKVRWVTVTFMQNEPRVYAYAIEAGDGELVFTQSGVAFELGDCVVLWHAPQAPGPTEEYLFVAGTMEKSDVCSKR